MSHEIQVGSYIVSVSEHDDAEDMHGRLSMWRAFGGASPRVAVILSIPWYSETVLALNLLFSPVAYLKKDDVHGELRQVIENIRSNTEFLRSLDRSIVVNWVFRMLLTGVTCLKHEGFREEREWRGVYSPMRTPSPHIAHSVEVIGGVPQFVYQLPLDATVVPSPGDLDLAVIFDRLIISHPHIRYQCTRPFQRH
jgi:hypothetical protein